MTPTDKPCLPGCREDSHLRYGEGGVEYLSGPIRVVTGMIHAPNCPNAPNAPKEPAAPRCVVKDFDTVEDAEVWIKEQESPAPHAATCPKRPAEPEVEGGSFPAVAGAPDPCSREESPSLDGYVSVAGLLAHLDNPAPTQEPPKPEAESVDWPPSMDVYLALRRENEELRRRLQMLESDRSREANPDSRS